MDLPSRKELINSNTEAELIDVASIKGVLWILKFIIDMRGEAALCDLPLHRDKQAVLSLMQDRTSGLQLSSQ
jgi:hypothetical protein